MARGQHNAWQAMEERHAAEVKKLEGALKVAQAESLREQWRVAFICLTHMQNEFEKAKGEDVAVILKRLEVKIEAYAESFRKDMDNYMDSNGLSCGPF